MSEVMDYIPTRGFAAVSEKSGAAVVQTEKIERAIPEFTPDPEIVTLVHQLLLTERKSALRSVVFTAVEHGAGCSRIAAGVALLLTRWGKKVCLVEANFATPSLAERFGLPRGPGFLQALAFNLPITSYLHSADNSQSLSLLAAGTPLQEDHALLDRARLQSRLSELQNLFDLVIVDAAPAHYDETTSLACQSSGVVLVLEADRTRRAKAVAATNTLRSFKVEILGAVLNKRSFPVPEKVYRHL